MSEKPTTRDHRLALAGCIVIALLLVGGTIGAWIHRSLRQQRAIEQLDGCMVSSFAMIGIDGSAECLLTGPIQYGYEIGEDFEPVGGGPPVPEWLRQWLGVDFFATVRSACFGGGDELETKALFKLTGLRSLALFEGTSPDALKNVAEFTQLERLIVRGRWNSDEWLATLPRLPHLRILYLIDLRGITDRGLDQIAKISSLRELKLADGSFSDAGLAQLARLKNLERLDLSFRGIASDAVLEHLRPLGQLRELNLDYPAGKPALGLKHLGGLPALTSLGISGNLLTDGDFAQLPALPGVKKLALAKCDNLHATGLANLAKFPNLEMLCLRAMTSLDDECLKQLDHLPRLTSLIIDVNGSDLTDAGIAHLAELKHLGELEIKLDGPTSAIRIAIDEVGKKLPDCVIRFNE